MGELFSLVYAYAVPLLIFVLTLVLFYGIWHQRKLIAAATSSTRGFISDIMIERSVSLPARHRRKRYKAKRTFVPDNHIRITKTIERSVKFADEEIFEGPKRAAVEVTVFYEPGNPHSYYVKELMTPVWKDYVMAGCCACLTVLSVWLTFCKA